MLCKFKTTGVQITTFTTRLYIIIETSPLKAALGCAVQPGAEQEGWKHLGSSGRSTQKLFVVVKVPICEVEQNFVLRITS